MERNYLPLPLQMGAALGHVDIAICLRFILLALAVKRAIRIELEMEMSDAEAAAKGTPASAEDLYLYFTGSNSMRRLFESVGLKRVARDVTPLLQDYLAQHPATTQDEEASDPEEASSP